MMRQCMDADMEMISAANSSGPSDKKILRHKAEKAHIPGELHRKSVAAAFWECELYEELLDMSLADKWSFTKDDICNNFAGSKDAAAEFIVRNRVSTSYKHKCYQGCQNKGCGKLYVLDGNWKLCYAHCMYPVPVTILGYEGEINYPDVCPRNAENKSAFCDRHSPLVQQKGLPTKLRPFLEYCNEKNKDPSDILKELGSATPDANEDNAAVY